MKNMNCFFLTALSFLPCSVLFSQELRDASYNWKDSSTIVAGSSAQHGQFLKNVFPYPARPRDMWELGVHAGHSIIIGDVSPGPGFGGGISLRKSLGHTFSLRADYTGSLNYGLDYRPRLNSSLPGNYANNPWSVYGNRPFVANYKNALHQGNLDLVAVLNNESYYRGHPKNNFYTFIGYSVLSADIDVDAVDPSNQPYNFSGFNFSRKRSEIKNNLKSNIDLDYESNAPVLNGSRTNIGRLQDNQLLRHAASIGIGYSIKFSRRVNIGLEQRFTFPFNENMDGIYAGRSNDFVSYTSGRIGFNIGSLARRTEPLWWLNPNNFVYSELNRPTHMKLPLPILPDADLDGVTDQFDMEPNTPSGVPVDVRGVARDTDGDGVPDYKDAELLTPNTCFPVNASGVGVCAEPACCGELRAMLNSGEIATSILCKVGNLPSIQFRTGSATLTPNNQEVLNTAAAQIKADPSCKIKVTGYGTPNKRSQQLSWDRVNAVIRYLVEKKGISQDRFVFVYGSDGELNSVDLSATVEDGQSEVPPPYPQYRTQ